MEKCYRIWLSKLDWFDTRYSKCSSKPGQQREVLTLEISHPTDTTGRMHWPRPEEGDAGGEQGRATQTGLPPSLWGEQVSDWGAGWAWLWFRLTPAWPAGRGQPCNEHTHTQRLQKLEFTGNGKQMLGNCRDFPSSNFLSKRVETKRKENILKNKITMKSDRNYDRG